MKKLFNNPYFDHAIKALITIAVGLSLYFIIDVRDFVKYKQPYKDKEQDDKIINTSQMLNDKINYVDSINSLKNRNVNQRIDNLKDEIRTDIYEIKRKLDYLIGYKSFTSKNDEE